MKLKHKSKRAERLWHVTGDFGYVQGEVEAKDTCQTVKSAIYHVSSQYIEKGNDIVVREGRFKNLSEKSVTITNFSSRFVYAGGEYEVYTQRNTWQNESKGGWQPLITEVCGETCGLRNVDGMVPFFAVWNNQTGRGMAYHIMTKLPWKFTVKSLWFGGEANELEIELGINPSNLSLEIKAGEELQFPAILYYEFRNKLDMDCFKLHRYFNQEYPRREMPVVYNTWLYKFDEINVENVLNQIPAAKELGVEYFVIDAGWFGQGKASGFWGTRGDWYENTEDAFRGSMSEVSEQVRANGMKFGFWMEIETAGPDSKMSEEYKEYYFTYDHHGGKLHFFDFANPKACDYMLKTISRLIDQYQVSFIKFDFNQDLEVDISQKGFTDYFEGYQGLIERLKEKYPKLYLENCASGGHRMCLENGIDFDSFWLSDNQSVYEGMRIFKDTIRRMPPQMIEKWAAIQSIYDFKYAYGNVSREKLLTCNDATWKDVRGVQLSYLKGFLTGSPICFSCDLNGLSEEVRENLKTHIVQFKKDREFWKSAECRILADTESVLVLAYSDSEYKKIEIVVYTDRIRQDHLTVYPILNLTQKYMVHGNVLMDGEQIDKEGITIKLQGNYTSEKISLEAVG